MKYLPGKSSRSGQALLLVLLSMAVVLTVVLSILSRSITDVSVTTREEEALRAFSAAEAGVEQSLVIGTGLGETQIGEATFRTTVTSAVASAKEFASPAGLFSGESLTFWLVGHDDSGDLVCDATHSCFTGSQIKICWGKAGTPGDSVQTPAIEASIYYDRTPGNDATVRIARITTDPNTVRAASNHFSGTDGATCTTAGENFAFSKTINFAGLGIPAAVYQTQDGLQYLKVRMFYNTGETQPVGILVTAAAGNGNLPSQGLRISSVGVSGDVNRSIDVFEGYSEAPSIFDASVFSLGGLTQ